jgi:hypothetical protein
MNLFLVPVDIDNFCGATKKRKKRSEKLTSSSNKRKCSNKSPKLSYKQLKEENNRLKGEIEKYRQNWMPKYSLLVFI